MDSPRVLVPGETTKLGVQNVFLLSTKQNNGRVKDLRETLFGVELSKLEILYIPIKYSQAV